MQKHGAFDMNWCRLQDLNPPPHDYKSCALPDELSRHFGKRANYTLFDAGKSWWSALLWWLRFVTS